MVNKQKVKGTKFENDAVEILTEKIDGSTWKRVPGSGAMGTILGEPMLTGDITGTISSYPRKFKVECKVGYGGEKQFTLKKEWLDKILEEAKQTFSFPFLIAKFLGSRSGVRHFVVMDIDTFAKFWNEYSDLKKELDSLYERKK